MNLSIMESNIQSKVNKVLGLNNETETETNNETETETKGNSKMKFNLDINETETIETETETKKGFNLDLKKSDNKTIADLKGKGINQENLNLSTEKFAAIDNMLKSNNSVLEKMESINETFTQLTEIINDLKNGLFQSIKNQNTLETIESNLLKNQQSILNGINSIHAKNFQIEKPSNKKPETETIETEKPETKLKKGINTMEGFFNSFQSNFKGNFLGSKELTEETKPVFKALIEFIDDSSADTIETSIKAFKSNFTKSNSGKELNAKRSNKNFISAMVETIQAINKTDMIKDSKINSIPIDKQYFTKLFNTDKKTISDIIKQVKEYGEINDMVKETIIKFIMGLNNELTETETNKFFSYLETYLD